MIVFAAIMPHPPMSIPGIGQADDFKMLKKTLDSFETLRLGLEKADPDTIIIISPHAQMEDYQFVINSSSELAGSFGKFGLDEVFVYKNDVEIADKLKYICTMNDVPAHLHAGFLDHGALIPLYHLTKNIKPMVVHLAFSMMDYSRHYRYGELIRKVVDGIDAVGKRVAIIASGDLSHRLTPDAPAGFSPSANKFDSDIIHYLGENQIVGIMNMHEDIAREAAECGIRSIMILLGALHEKSHGFDLLSYEAPFGIGYLTARLL